MEAIERDRTRERRALPIARRERRTDERDQGGDADRHHERELLGARRRPELLEAPRTARCRVVRAETTRARRPPGRSPMWRRRSARAAQNAGSARALARAAHSGPSILTLSVVHDRHEVRGRAWPSGFPAAVPTFANKASTRPRAACVDRLGARSYPFSRMTARSPAERMRAHGVGGALGALVLATGMVGCSGDPAPAGAAAAGLMGAGGAAGGSGGSTSAAGYSGSEAATTSSGGSIAWSTHPRASRLAGARRRSPAS